MNMDIKLGGLAEHVSQMNRRIKELKVVNKAGLYKAGLLIKRRSQEQVPVDTGDLKGSAYCIAEETWRGLRVAIGYTKVYAVRQHEEIGYQHTVGKAKFLEDPFKESVEDVLAILIEANRRANA